LTAAELHGEGVVGRFWSGGFVGKEVVLHVHVVLVQIR